MRSMYEGCCSRFVSASDNSLHLTVFFLKFVLLKVKEMMSIYVSCVCEMLALDKDQ